jgi:homoserine dehydrogenase
MMAEPILTQPPLQIAIGGLGTVGCGLIELISANADILRQRMGRPIEIVAVSARERTRERKVDISGLTWVDDPLALADLPNVDVIVELIGGSENPALALVERALASGKGVVTANKALIAHHGMALAALAEERDVPLRYEAAVAGGIPVVKGLREGLAANRIARIYGILNGTCNYMLTAMERDGRDFAEVLAEAQALGYAEADPSFDIDGVDAAHKLSILAAIAFGHALDFDGVAIDGIRQVLAADIAQARALGYKIRLLGMARCDNGKLFQRVQPYLVPFAHPLAEIDGSTNAVVAEGNFAGQLIFQGAGAGYGPTASAVMADLIEIARDEHGLPFALPVAAMPLASRADSGERVGKSYIRFLVADRPGVLAEITAAMRDANVSIESLIQTEKTADGSALIAVVTHACREADVSACLALLEASPSMTAPPVVMHLLGERD